ncbi:MAG: class I SAM-dependent methyltransferase [Candidatus Lokiarchaeia archaeon]
MTNFKAKMFNKKASDPKNKPDQILESLELQRGQTIADIGAGGGYFTLRFAEAVGKEGQVYAIDTDPGFLEFIRDSAEEKGLNNVKTILTTEDELNLPEKSLDLIFMRNVSHHLKNRVEYYGNLKRFLKSKGRIVIIEYKGGGRFSFRGMFGHYVSKEIILQEMVEAGYQLQKDFDFLPEQSFTIFLSKK